MENNKYNMVAVDLDGTLVKNDKTISRTTKKVFIELQKRGVRLILASGRCVLGISQVAKQLELGRYGGYMLAFNGGRIIDASNNKTMFSNEIAVDLYSRIFEIRNEYNLDILSYNKEQNCLISNNILNKFAELDSKINNMKLIEVKDFENYVTYKEPKFLMLGEPDKLEKIEAPIRNKLKDSLEVYRSEPCFIEILPKGIDKGSSLAWLCKYLDSSMSELLAIGDSYNDINMIRLAGCGVAMDNAVKKLKAVSDYVTNSNEEDGAARAVERIIQPGC